MVEMTLIWNNVQDVIGANGTIAYPAQLLPLMIGALGLVRILYIIYRDWRPRRTDVEHGLQTTSAAEVGLGVNIEKEPREGSCCHSEEDVELDESVVQGRSILVRYLVAWAPWLSVSELWLKPNRERKASIVNAANPRNSTQPLMATTPITPAMEPSPQTPVFRYPKEVQVESPVTESPKTPQVHTSEIESPKEPQVHTSEVESPRQPTMSIYDLVTGKSATATVKED